MKTRLLFTLLFLPFLSLAQAPTDTVDIPDGHFKYMLLYAEEFGMDTIDTNQDDEIQYSEAEAVTHLNLDVSVMNGFQAEDDSIVNNNPQNDNPLEFGPINDLTGMEAFTNLTYLALFQNNLDTLNLNSNILLDTLYCAKNELTSLNIRDNLDLTILNCAENNIEDLDISYNHNLKEISIEENNISQLNVEMNLDLKKIICRENQIDSLDLQENSNLKVISCSQNNLSYLNIQNGNNPNLAAMLAEKNPDLKCIFVDDTVYASNNSEVWKKDATAHYVETEEECEALGVEDYAFQKIDIYPNPVKNQLNISGLQNSTDLRLYNLQGKNVLSREVKESETALNLSDLTSGIYFLQIALQNQSKIFKIIKL